MRWRRLEESHEKKLSVIINFRRNTYGRFSTQFLLCAGRYLYATIMSTMGIRTLDESNRVVFSPVEILEDGAGGVWITGLPATVSLITVGQEYVALGEIVEPVYSIAGRNQVVSL